VLDKRLEYARSDGARTGSVRIYEQRVKITEDHMEKIGFLKKMMNEHPLASTLIIALRYAESDDTKALERILASKSVAEYANYLDANNRPEEVMEMIRS
jgi:hypothetical protein